MTWYKNVVEAPGEMIFEIINEDDGLGYGIALAFISNSEPHFHLDTLERYILMDGKLLVHLGREKIKLSRPFDQVKVPKGVFHWAEADPQGSTAKVLVISLPAWSEKDHHKVDLEQFK